MELCDKRTGNTDFQRRDAVKASLCGPDFERQMVEKQASVDTPLSAEFPAFPGHAALLPNLIAGVEDGDFVG